MPGFGWDRFAPAPLTHPVRCRGGRGHEHGLANGLVTVVVEPDDGTFSLDGRPGLRPAGRRRRPRRHLQLLAARPRHGGRHPDSVVVTVRESGPVPGHRRHRVHLHLARYVDGHTQPGSGAPGVTVTTTVELRADEPVVRVRTRFVNPSRDHRLRVHLPLPSPAATSEAECAFTVVERGLTAEGRTEEIGLPTFPSRRFVSGGGLTVVHEGLLEYELVDLDGRRRDRPVAGTLALTLLRATGMLSRLGMSLRPLPAGPMDALDGPQLLGPVDVSYAVAVGDARPVRPGRRRAGAPAGDAAPSAVVTGPTAAPS